MSTLGQFASLAYQTLDSIQDLRSQIAAREKAEAALRELASGLEAKIRRLVDANIMGIFIWGLDGEIIEDSVPGDPASPVGWDLLEAKFRDCVSFAHRPLIQGGAERMIELVHQLDCLEDATEIIHLFS